MFNLDKFYRKYTRSYGVLVKEKYLMIEPRK